MDSVILHQTPLENLLDQVRQIIKEEMQAANTKPVVSEEERKRPVTTKELCAFLGITEPTVIRWREKGKIPFYKIGSAVRYDLDAVLKSLNKK